MKYQGRDLEHDVVRSRPVWGAWIEMTTAARAALAEASRAPYGARGLKCYADDLVLIDNNVAPRMGRVD